MADIRPVSTTLPDITLRNYQIRQEFTPILGGGEAMVNIRITKHDSPPGISVSGAVYSGAYNYDVIYPLLRPCLWYFDEATQSIKTANSMANIPPGNKVTKFVTPKGYKTVYTYTVVMNWTKNGKAQPPITKVYRQTVIDNWDIHKKALKDYV